MASLRSDQFEEFLAEIANRVFYSQSSLPTPVLLDKLRAVILEEINEGSLKELHAFTKDGFYAYRLPWPKGQVLEDGSERITIEDFSYAWRPLPVKDVAASKKDSLEAFQVSSWILDELMEATFQ